MQINHTQTSAPSARDLNLWRNGFYISFLLQNYVTFPHSSHIGEMRIIQIVTSLVVCSFFFRGGKTAFANSLRLFRPLLIRQI